ncbi:hypothetical protein [Limimaricola hongkongensis]|uniref:hypothetical protein n=1 Tax=Limimaricola hongkongensis TaxID=278132 RepID=UPI000A6958B4|nr:hypothetical protein [Limimaricola hongkongensis]
MYTDVRMGMRYDYLLSPKPGSDRLFVFFSGDAPRQKFTPPVFQRWTWSEFFPGSCLYISDPTLQVDDSLGLAWYAGTEEFDPLSVISDTISGFSRSLGVKLGSVYTYGSSGGGFAALRILTFMPEASAVCINPQTDVTAYNNGSVGKFLSTCFGGRSRKQIMKDFPERVNLIHHSGSMLGRRIMYIQNEMDRHHYDKHYVPFCLAMGVIPLHPCGLNGSRIASSINKDGFSSIIFSDRAGHSKAESREAFECAMSNLND